MTREPGRPPVPDGWLTVLVAVAVAVTFWPSVGAGFVFDDEEYVQQNGMVLDGLTTGGFTWALTAFHSSNWHPLTWISLQLDVTLFGPGPAGFHRTNVFLHAFAAGLTYLALRQLTGSVGRSLAVALLFGLHPLRVESVSWVSERKDVLSGVFWMLTLLTYHRYTVSPSAGRMLLVAAVFACGLSSKPMLVTLPFVLLLLDAWPLGRANGVAEVWCRVREKWPLFVLVVGSVVATVLAQSKSGAVQGFDRVPMETRLAGAPVAFVVYLGMTAWPVDLAVFYPIPPAGRPIWQPLAALALLVGVTARCFASRRRAPFLLVGWLWFVGTLVPVIGLVQVGGQAYADRYTYIPHVGLFLALVWGVADIGRWLAASPRMALGLTGVTAVACTIFTVHQQQYWHGSQQLWGHALAVAPIGNSTAHINLGAEFMRQGRHAEAMTQFRAAVETARPADPVAVMAQSKIAQLSFLMGDMDGVERAACQVVAAPSAGRGDKATCWFIRGEANRRRNDLSKAEECYRESIRTEDGWNARLNLGVLLGETGRADEALEHLTAAQQIGPNVPECNHALGAALADRGDFSRAVPFLERAIRLRPESGRYHGTLAAALLELGRPDSARQEAHFAARLDPGWLDWSYRTAWELGADPDPARRNGPKAVRMAAAALLASDPPDPLLLDALAAGAAEAGRFDDAVRVGEMAAKRADAIGSTEATAIRGRVERYRSRQPYRTTP